MSSYRCIWFHIFLFFLSVLQFRCTTIEKTENWPEQARAESKNPIRPGPPFWNAKAVRFIYAPSFDFKQVQEAQAYRFSAYSGIDDSTYTFQSDNPMSALSPIWPDLPVGPVKLVVETLDQADSATGVAGSREFYKASVFAGPYQGPAVDYRESARMALQHLFEQAPVQHWLQSNEPDNRYILYCYPSKIIGAVTEGMLLYARLVPEDSSQAMTIAKRSADFLISISEPAQAPLAFFPPTYRGRALSAAAYRGQVMLNMPSDVARIYLDLFDRTGDERYFQAARNIADTYLKIQLSSGTWKLKLDMNSGNPATQNNLIPVNVITLFDRLINQYDLDHYKAARDKALAWILQNPIKTYNWEGQYEDVMPQSSYQNLTEHQACAFAIYLLNPRLRTDEHIKTAAELTRFAEDQFVVWEKPLPDETHSFDWLTPCVLEQYHFYEAVDASAAKMIATYQALHDATGRDIYLAKAISLANNMTVIQKRYKGRYSTWWRAHEQGDDQDWINCAVYDAAVMLKFADYINSLDAEEDDLTQKDLLLLLASPASEEIAGELTRRFRNLTDTQKKVDLLRYFAQADPLRVEPLLQEGIFAKNDTLKLATISFLGIGRDINQLGLFADVLKSKDPSIHKALAHSYRCVADNYLRIGNEFLAREYFHLVLQREADYFDKRLAVKRLESIGTASSLRYLQPYLTDRRLSEFAASSWLTILLRNPDQMQAATGQDILQNLVAAGDPDLEGQMLSALQKRGVSRQMMQEKAAINGFLPGWLVAGPFPLPEQAYGGTPNFPEEQIDLSQKTGAEHWQSVNPYSVFGIADFAGLFGKVPGIAYAYCELNMPESGNYLLRIGSNDGAACRVNGEWIYQHTDTGRPLKIDEDQIPVEFKEGKNQILLKVVNLGGNWQVCLRVCDARGNPLNLKSLLISQQQGKYSE